MFAGSDMLISCIELPLMDATIAYGTPPISYADTPRGSSIPVNPLFPFVTVSTSEMFAGSVKSSIKMASARRDVTIAY